MLSNNPKLNALAARAIAAFNVLPLEQQRAHRREQRISWVYGEMRLSGYDISREEVAAIVDGYEGET